MSRFVVEIILLIKLLTFYTAILYHYRLQTVKTVGFLRKGQKTVGLNRIAEKLMRAH